MKCRRLHTLRLDRFAVGAWAEHEIHHLIAEHCLFALRIVQRVHQRERLVVFVAERTHGLAFDAVARRLRAGMRRRQHLLRTRERRIDGEMMAAELHHPLACGGRLAKNGQVVFAATKTHAHRCLPRRRGSRLEQLVGIDNRHDLLVAVTAQCRREQRQRGLLLCRRHVGEFQTVPLGGADLHGDASRQVRPDDTRLLVEVQIRFPPLRLVQRLQERVGRRDRRGR